MPRITERLKLSLPLSNEYVQREVLVKAFEEIDKLVMLQGDLDSLKEIVNKYTDEAVKKLKEDTENKAGKPNGLATLDKDGKVPTTQLPKREAKDVNLVDVKGYYSEKTVESALQQVGADLAETDKKTQLLQHGLNVLNAPTASPLSVEIQGRTLVNLLGQTNLDNTKYYAFIPNKGTTKITFGGKTYEEGVKFTGQATVSYVIKQDLRGKVAGSVIENGHSLKAVGNGDGLLLPSGFSYEVTTEDYKNINSLDNKVYKSTATIANRQAQHLIPFDIIRTLQDKFGLQIWQGKTTLADKITIAKQVITGITCNWHGFGTSPIGNKATIKRWLGDADGWFSNTNHTNSTIARLVQRLTNTEINAGKAIDSNGFSYFLVHADPSNGTVASVINTDYVELELEVNLNLPLLEDTLYEVDQATYNKINVDPEYSGQKLADKFPYVQGVQHLNPVMNIAGTNPSYLYTNTSLVGINGINDVLYQDDGLWKVLRKWEYAEVKESTTWGNDIIAALNCKSFKITSIKAPIYGSQNDILIDFKGNKISNGKIWTDYNSNALISEFISQPDGLHIKVPNIESGFSGAYAPSGEEINAYFNGWKVKTSDTNGKPIAWKSVVDDKDAPTQTLAYVKANRAPNYTPYKLTYQLATPRVEAVIVEGDLAVSGMAQITVDSGIVVREKVSPQLWSGSYYINNPSVSTLSQLKNKNYIILCIYKNGVPDLKWNISTHFNAYGRYQGKISQADYDPTAEYTVTYLVQDKHQFTTNPIDVKATYNQSLKTSVTELVEKQADVATGLSILVNATSENTKDIVALKKATADNTTDITDLKNKMNTNSTKLDKHLESLSRFRSSKDDNGIFRTIEWKTKSGILRRKAVITVSTTTGDYDKQIVTEYANDGTTITSTDEYKLILDGDGDIVNEVLQ